MWICTAKFSKKKALLAIVLIAAAVAAIVFLKGRVWDFPQKEEAALLQTNEDRVAYLRDLGWEVEEEPVESLQFVLPETLEEPYLSYNALQIPQGFDLGRYCGQSISRYTYTVTNYPERPKGVQANLYICEDAPIAGDILCPGANGFQEALIQQQEK